MRLAAAVAGLTPSVKSTVLRRKLRLLTFIALAVSQGHTSSNTGPNRPDLPFVWEDHLGRLNQDEFRRRYRLTPTGFYE